MLIKVRTMLAVETTSMKETRMISVLDLLVTTVLSMGVRMVLVGGL